MRSMKRAKIGPKYSGDESSRRQLTKRELEILRLIADGYKNREVAEALRISIKTVETHRANIKNKLGMHHLSQLVKYAIKHKLTQVEG